MHFAAEFWRATDGAARRVARGLTLKFITSNFAVGRVTTPKRTSLQYALHAIMIFIALQSSNKPDDLKLLGGNEVRHE